ncbi:MAG: OmpA family protein [Candidatus Eisenbacteria sp.]|nr:OmpA family protein [Candidatus Eisenbacteria bacterium]
MNRFKTIYLLLLFFISTVTVHAQAVKEHPLIRPFPGSVLMHGTKHLNQNFAEYSFSITDPQTGKKVKKPVRGKFWKLTYILLDSNGKWDASHSILEYRENYKQAALENAGTILYENQGYLTFTLPGDDGSETWCEVHIWNQSMQDLRIIEQAEFKKTLTFGPAEMKAALDAEGRVQLHDILFDLDRASLQPKSTKQLQHVVTLLKENPDLKLEVQGHTDDQGSEAYNLELSQNRAETVVAYLGLFGIDITLLTPRGFGESKPLMPNTSEEGQAKNRRVELVRLVSQDASVKEGISEDVTQLIVGEWEIAPNKRASKGSITFDENGSYVMHEQLHDGTGVGTKGEYRLNSNVTPVRIDLCLDKCGKPGSEWTTRFGIMRVLANDKLEIHTSPDSKHPSNFSDDTSDEYTMMLTRTQ